MIMKKSLLVIVLALAMLLSLSSLFGQLKPILQEVYDFGGSFPANVIYPAAGTISYTTYVVSRPADVQAGPTPLCTAGMSSGRFLLEFNMGNFANPWTVGDILRIEVVQAGTGRLASVEFALNAEFGINGPQARFDGLSMVLVNPPTKLFDSTPPTLNPIGGTTTLVPGYPQNGVYRAQNFVALQYWQIQFSTIGATNLNLTSLLNRELDDDEEVYGPRRFRMWYSTTGTEPFTQLGGNVDMGLTDAQLIYQTALPVELENQPTVYFRWSIWTTSAASGYSGGWGGIQNVIVTGDVEIVPEDFELAITANYPGAAILYSADGVDGTYAPTGQTADHTFAAGDAAAGWYKMGDLAGVVWTNNPYHFENTADAAFRFLGTKTPGFAINPLPADGATIEWPWDAPATGDVVLSWDPIVGVTGYNVYWNGAEIPVPVVDPTWTAEGLAVGEYTWKVVPYITDPVKGTVNLEPVRAKINDRGVSVKGTPNPADAPVWGFEIVRLPEPVVYDFDPAEDYTIGTVTVNVVGDNFQGGNEVVDPVINPVPNAAFIATTQGVLELIGTGEVTIQINCPDQWFVYNIGAGWVSIAGPLVDYPLVINLGNKDAQMEYKSGNGGDPTLPVELSSFNAVLTAQYFVKLTWISQSETNLNGYRVYRSENTELVNATMITPIIISATNTSSTQVYSIEDREVAFGNTYWYWLESVENDGSSNFHGPTSVFVEGEVPPVLPQATTMRSAYPNPFKAASTTTIEVAVKEGESGSLTIYNVLGQVVKTYSLNQGIHNLKWNGKDNKGNICSSGIYFYKLSTPTMNQTDRKSVV